MTSHRVKRRSKAHPGVKVLRLADGRHVARWIDPLSKVQQQQSLDRLGATNEAMRRAWAVKKAEALAALRRAVTSGVVESSRVSVKSAVESYLAAVEHDGTRLNKSCVLDAFVEWCGKAGIHELAEINGPRLMRWRDYVLRPGNPHVASTRNRWLVTSGIFLRWASKRGLAPMLPFDSVRNACERGPEPQKAIEFLRPEQLRTLLRCAIDHDEVPSRRRKAGPFLLALLLSGMRFDEMAQLRWEEVDLAAGEIRLPAERVKTKAARIVAMKESPLLAALLLRMRARAGAQPELVFDFPQHSAWESVRLRLIEEHGAPAFTAHGLRRTCGTLLTNAAGIYGGASAWHSAKRLGHSVEMAERLYAGVLRDLPADARCIEDAAGVRDLASAIVEAV